MKGLKDLVDLDVAKAERKGVGSEACD
uniref:Uncharacterized protein n=1 Tax=Oryza glumipatula TaxID=40148 RepID=A0A0E0BFE9_9ORYZ